MFYLAYRKKKIKNENVFDVFERVRGEYAALLHSGKGERYSFIGYEPFMMLESKDEMNELSFFEYKVDEIVRDVQVLNGDPLAILQSLIDQLKLKKVEKDLPPFVGGPMGYMSYEFGMQLMNVMPMHVDELETPDLMYCFYDKVVAFDHEMKDMYFFAISESSEKAQKLVDEVMKDALHGVEREDRENFGKSKVGGEIDVLMEKKNYSERIAKIKKFLKSGDTYQVNFSYRFSFETPEDPWGIYKRLHALNPSPCSLFFDFPEVKVISSSPERLISLHGGVAQTRPIKGTRPRGKNAREDEKIAVELMASEKDNAELSMIVDLMRNDLGKVCEPHSVKVVRHREIEKYSHVMHTVSTVEGKLKKGVSATDVIRAVFPGGSVTGCPKKRTMEIIRDVELCPRDVYCGSAGYISMSGNMDLNILIRTLVWKDGTVYFHSGGGIVMDSEPEKEFEETLDKAQALVEAVTGV